MLERIRNIIVFLVLLAVIYYTWTSLRPSPELQEAERRAVYSEQQ